MFTKKCNSSNTAVNKIPLIQMKHIALNNIIYIILIYYIKSWNAGGIITIYMLL